MTDPNPAALPIVPRLRARDASSAPERDLADRLSARIRTVLRRSLHVRQLDAGSCNGCDWEIQALLGPVYDVQRLGIDVVASPRHADLLLVTGSVTRNLEAAARATYEAMPEPRLVVAVGACACGGGVLQGSYCTAGGVANVLPVDLFIPGCPPRPQALLYGLLTAVGRMQPRLAQTEVVATARSRDAVGAPGAEGPG
jgi:Ni,Fe-hydrogenase III small subunit